MNPPTPPVAPLSPTISAPMISAPVIFEEWWVIGFVVLAAIACWAMSRLIEMPGLHRLRRWLALGRAVLFSLVVLDVVFALSFAVGEHWVVLGVVVLAVAAMAAIGWLRSAAAGLALALEDRFRIGDTVRHGDHEGDIVHLGARAVTLRAHDATLVQIPNERFIRDSLTYRTADGETACDIIVQLPTGVTPDRAMRLAQQAAFLTPLASPRRHPEVFLGVADAEAGGVHLHIRGYPFDSAFGDHFRSDVVARVHSLLRAERGMS